MELKTLHTQQSQQGITLLLSILLLASISAIAFSVASITLIEVRTSGDVQRTEPIFYSDQGIAEEAVYGLKRKASPATATAPTALYFGGDCSTSFVPYIAPDTSVTSQVKICNVAPGDVVVRVPASAVDYATAKRLYMFDPSPGNQGTGPGGYEVLNIENISTINAAVRVFICHLDEECQSPAQGTSDWVVDGRTGANDIDQGSTGQFSGVIDPARSYEISLINLSGQPQDLFVRVVTEKPGGVSYGLPYLNKKKVEIQSTKSGLTRRVEVLVPTQ